MAKKKTYNTDWAKGPDGKGLRKPTHTVADNLFADIDDTLLSFPESETASELSVILHDENGLHEMMSHILKDMPPEELEIFMKMSDLAMAGVTPEEYSDFYRLFEISGAIAQNFADYDAKGIKKKNATTKKHSKADVKGAVGKTLVLKIQMKGVTKPPMWREVEVGADITFENLHYIIQCVVGLENCHLWQFNKHAYDDSILIGNKSKDEYDMGLHHVTDNASKTPLAAYLLEKGDTLEYFYDFGDDWIFTITVKSLLDKKTDHPICTGYKSDLNAMEDIGGPWVYEDMRKIYKNWDKATKKQRQEWTESMGFEDTDDFKDFLDHSIFDLAATNARLQSL